MRKTFREKIKELPPRLLFALGCYLVLFMAGFFVLLPIRSREELGVLGFFLAVFCFFTWKTIVHANKGEL
jgi:hypothetical protein